MAEDVVDKIKKVIEGTYDSTKRVADMNYKVSDAGKDLSAVFGNMGVVGKMAGAVIGDMAKYAQESVTAWQGVSKFGLSFGNDAIGLRTAAAQTRMTFDDYNKFIGNNKDVLSSWGGSMTEGAKKFNALSEAYAASTMTIDGVTVSTSDKMAKMGITTEEMNDVLALTMSSQRMLNKDTKENQRAAIESATQLAMEMDKMAKLTGMSREEQMKGLKEKQLDVQYQAQTRLLMAGLTEAQKKEMGGAITAYQNTATRLGGSTALAMKEIATGGIRSKEAAEAMSRLGPAGIELQKAFQAVRDAKTPELKQAAELQLARAEQKVLEVQQSKSFQQQVARGDEASVKLAQASQKQQMSLEAVAAANDKRKALDLNTAEGFAQAQKEQAALALKEQTTDAAGTTEAVTLFNQRAKDAGAVINKVFVEDLNNTVSKALKSKETGQAIGLKGSINDQMAGQRPDGKTFTEKFTEGAENSKQKVKDKVVQGANVLKDLQDSKIGQIAGVALGKLGSVVEGTYMRVKNIVGGDTRDTGTLGMTGKLFEPQDFFGKVQKGETVLTPEQLQNLVRGTMATASEKSAGSADNLRSMMETKFAAIANDKTSGDKLRSTIETKFAAIANDKTSKAPSMGDMAGGMMSKAQMEMMALGMTPPSNNQTATNTDTTSDIEPIESTFSGDSSLSEVVEELVQLNKNIGNLIGLTQDSLENTGRQLKATKGLSGNLFA